MSSGTALPGWADLLRRPNLPRLLLLWLAVWLEAADSLVTATIMPTVGTQLGGFHYLGWATGGFLVGAIVAGASAGKISELLGLKQAMMLGGATLMIGCTVSAAAPTMEWFLVGRLLQGFGGGWIVGLSMVAIALLFPERQLARVFASVSAVWGVATVLGPLLGGVLVEQASWRVVFWLFAVQAGIFLLAVPFTFGGLTRRRPESLLPVRQLTLLVLGMTAMAFAADPSSWAAAVIALVAGSLCLAAILRIEARSKARLLPAQGLSLQFTAGAGYAAMLLLTGAAMPLIVYGPALLQALCDLSPLAAGYVIAAQAATWTIAAFFAAATSPAQEQLVIRAGSICILGGTALLVVVMPAALLPAVIGAAALQGFGFGLCSSLMNRRVLRTLTDEDREIGSSALMAVRQVGGAIGAAVVTAVANATGLAAGVTEIGAYRASIWVNLCGLPFALLGVYAVWRMTGRRASHAKTASVIFDQ